MVSFILTLFTLALICGLIILTLRAIWAICRFVGMVIFVPFGLAYIAVGYPILWILARRHRRLEKEMERLHGDSAITLDPADWRITRG